MSWGNLESAANSGNGGRYLKLKDGSRFELLLISDPFTKEVTWGDGRTSQRFACVVYCTDSPAGAQQLEFGPGVARKLSGELKGQDPRKVKVMVKRTGSGKTDTEYTVARLGSASLDEITAAKVADADRLWDLEEDGWCPLEPSAPVAAARTQGLETGPDADIPF